MSTELLVRPFGTAAGGAGGILHSFPRTNIESYSSEAVFADDGITPISSRYNISGTILMVEEDWTQVQYSLGVNATRCYSILLTNGVQPLIDFTAGTSNIGGPYLKLTGTQVMGGGGVVLARFEMNDEVSWCGTTAVLSHTWTQKFTLNEAQMLSRSVSGALKIRRSSSSTNQTYPVASGNAWASVGPSADLYRLAIIPVSLGYGWRRKSQEFALDATSTILLYTVQDEQHLHDLPPEVRVGEMDFSYERSATDAGIGHVSVTVELEGSLALKNLMQSSVGGLSGGNRYLVSQAITLSKARIDANFSGTLITRMKVTENKLLSGFSIRFELDAMVFPTATEGNILYPLATMVGRFFEIRNGSDQCKALLRQPNPYGPAVEQGLPTANRSVQRWSMVPHYSGNGINGMNCGGNSDPMPTASVFSYAEGDADCSTTTVYIADQGAASTVAMNSAFDGKFKTEQTQYGADSGFVGILAKSTVITHIHYDTGMVRLPTMYVNKPDVLIQVGKPFVTIKERTEIVRANNAPSRIMRPLAPQAFLISEDWNCNYGQFDAQGNRVCTAVYERVYGLYDEGTEEEPNPSGNGFITQDSKIRAWRAPFGVFLPPLTKSATDASQAPALSVLGEAVPEPTDPPTPTVPAIQYAVPPQDFFTT